MKIITNTEITPKFASRMYRSTVNEITVNKIYDKVINVGVTRILNFLEGIKSDTEVIFRPKMDITTAARTVIETTDSSGWHLLPKPVEVTYGPHNILAEEEIEFTYKNFNINIHKYENIYYVYYTSIFTGNRSTFIAHNSDEVIDFIVKKTPAKKPIKKEKVGKKNDKDITRVKSLITRRTNEIENMKNEIERLKKMISEYETSIPELNNTLENLIETNM